MQNPGKAIVVIPLYKNNLSETEDMSLRRTLEVLNSHPFAIICPEKLDLAPLEGILQAVNYRVERFDNDYFTSIDGYNSLMLTEMFYQRFTDYEYMLICQTDVFVFRDELLEWCAKGYDYIGAPWIASKRTPLNKLLMSFNNMIGKRKKKDHHYFKVGNGGFSLRKVPMILYILKHKREHNHQHKRLEDFYFSLVAPVYIPEMRIPGYEEAVGFAIDRKPKLALKINKNKIPFGCHGFNKPNVESFWKPIIAKHFAKS